jgi:hypothetical protein
MKTQFTMEGATLSDGATISPIVEALTGVWDSLARHAREEHGVTVAPALIVIQRSDSKRGVKLGHITTLPAWKTGDGQARHEVVITGECLRRTPAEVFGTLAHECAHAVNIAKGVKDTDSNGRHNTRFRDTAQAVFGLLISQVGSIGWSATEVPEETQAVWSSEIDAIATAVTAYALTGLVAPTTGKGKGTGDGEEGTGEGEGEGEEPKKRDKNLTKATCGCGDSIRASRRVLDKGVFCDECKHKFEAEEK